ncbi:MAG: hypothetical protein ACXV3D_06275 [Halobacteriota archaeon]
MTYQLVLSAPHDSGVTTKDVFENVIFSDMPRNYEVYLLCFPGTSMNEDLREELRKFGTYGGAVLFVNFATKLDRNYGMIRNTFDITTWPTLIMTGLEKLASPPTDPCTAYVKIDNKELLNAPTQAIECVDKIFHLFLEGEISKAIEVQTRSAREARMKEIITRALTGVLGFLRQWEIDVSFIEGRLSLKPVSGGAGGA